MCQTHDVQFTVYADLHCCASLGSQQICTLDTPIPYGSLQDTPDHHHCKPNLHFDEIDDYRVSCKLLHDVGASELHCGSVYHPLLLLIVSNLYIICLHVNMTVTVWLQADLHDLQLSVDTFGTKFDVVLIDPPWEEYVRRAPGVSQGESWSWQEIKNLEIDKITDNPSFIFLW